MSDIRQHKRISFTKRSRPLHIEAPGCIVNIEVLRDSEGRPVTRIDVSADGDRYTGNPEWWCIDAGATLQPKGIGIRIVEGITHPPVRNELIDALADILDNDHAGITDARYQRAYDALSNATNRRG